MHLASSPPLAKSIAVLTAAIAFAAFSPHAQATLVFAKKETKGSEETAIYVANDDGSNQRRLVSGSYSKISPDGQAVAFKKERGKEAVSDLYVIPAGGGRAKRVVKNIEWPSTQFSPDSKKLAALKLYKRKNGDEYSRVIVVDAASGATLATPYPTVDETEIPISFSPTSDAVAYTAISEKRLHAKVSIHSLVTGQQIDLTQERLGFFPVWGSSGIAYGNVTLKKLSKSQKENLEDEDFILRNPTLKLIQPDGTNSRTVTGFISPKTASRDLISPVSWLPNGRDLIVKREIALEKDSDSYQPWSYYLVNTVNGTVQKIGSLGKNDEVFGVSKDGQHLLIQRGGQTWGSLSSLLKLPLSGGKAQVLVRNALQPDWNY